MKVAIVTHNVTKGDGQGWVNYQLAKGLAERGYEVHVYANRIDRELLQLRGIRYYHIPVFIQRPNLIKIFVFAFIATILLAFRKYDILHLNGFTAFNKHHINTSHFVHSKWKKVMKNVESPTLYHTIYAWINSWIEKLVYRRAKRIVAVSKKVKDELIEDVGISEDRIIVIHNGIDKDYWKKREINKEDYLKNLGIKKEDFVILFAGDLARETKGLRRLLYALKDIDGVKLLIAGDERRSIFKETIISLGIQDRAIHIGFRKDLPELFSTVDAFIFPSLYDSFSMVILEASSCGCPVVVSSSPFVGAAERIKDGENGLIINNPFSVEEIKEKILLLKREPELRNRLSKNAPSIVKDVKEMVEEYIKVYEEVMESR